MHETICRKIAGITPESDRIAHVGCASDTDVRGTKASATYECLQARCTEAWRLVDDVHDTAHGSLAIQHRSRAFENLDRLNVEAITRAVHHVRRARVEAVVQDGDLIVRESAHGKGCQIARRSAGRNTGK